MSNHSSKMPPAQRGSLQEGKHSKNEKDFKGKPRREERVVTQAREAHYLLAYPGEKSPRSQENVRAGRQRPPREREQILKKRGTLSSRKGGGGGSDLHHLCERKTGFTFLSKGGIKQKEGRRKR